jgi:hypothetical protein
MFDGRIFPRSKTMYGKIELDEEVWDDVSLWSWLQTDEGPRSLAIQRRFLAANQIDYDYETLAILLEADIVPGYVDEDPANVFYLCGFLCDDPLDGEPENPRPKVGVRYTYVKARFTLQPPTEEAA